MSDIKTSGEKSGDVRKPETAKAGVGTQMPRAGSTPAAAHQPPTEQQRALAQFADEAEASGLKTSLYYRLWPQIQEARAAIAKEARKQ